jgi:hypothetical protein
MNPRHRVWAAWGLLLVCVVAWPVSAMTVFRDEPQGILGLSWAAIIITCLDIISTQDVRKQQEGDGDAS